MKVRLADYVADFLVSKNITDCFMITGGGAMHLNDALGHHEQINCIYNHHEQACAIAAESYARINNTIAAVCVTTGPGGTNAITGVLGGWLDSIPMMVISGQVRYDTTARYQNSIIGGANLRAVGDQEYDITKSVRNMCKYAVMIEDPKDIRYVMEKAYHLAMSGRRGPVWIDIPLNFQAAIIETEDLHGYRESEEEQIPEKVTVSTIHSVLNKLADAKRPVIYAGNGVRLSGAYRLFHNLINILRIPVVTCWDSIDLIEDDNLLYTGRGGIMGDRAGNFAVQNADLLLVIGNRLSIRQVGYNWDTWAREAEVIMVDVDKYELLKKTIHVEMPIHADAKDFITKMLTVIEEENIPLSTYSDWLTTCQEWKNRYPVTQDKHWKDAADSVNVYAFIKYLSSQLDDGNVTVVSNGSACVVGSHNYTIKKGSRFIINSGVASMGYGLPAAIGACVACNKEAVICIEGDGSIMMNLQELQTIVTNRLPIKVFLINNAGYHSIRQTQNNLFSQNSKIGIGPESNDLSFPDFSKIAMAFGLPYYFAKSNDDMKRVVETVLSEKGPLLCEIFVSIEQCFEPKSATKRLEDGSLVSPPLEDMAPFLSREELAQNMFVPMID